MRFWNWLSFSQGKYADFVGKLALFYTCARRLEVTYNCHTLFINKLAHEQLNIGHMELLYHRFLCDSLPLLQFNPDNWLHPTSTYLKSKIHCNSRRREHDDTRMLINKKFVKQQKCYFTNVCNWWTNSLKGCSLLLIVKVTLKLISSTYNWPCITTHFTHQLYTQFLGSRKLQIGKNIWSHCLNKWHLIHINHGNKKYGWSHLTLYINKFICYVFIKNLIYVTQCFEMYIIPNQYNLEVCDSYGNLELCA